MVNLNYCAAILLATLTLSACCKCPNRSPELYLYNNTPYYDYDQYYQYYSPPGYYTPTFPDYYDQDNQYIPSVPNHPSDDMLHDYPVAR